MNTVLNRRRSSGRALHHIRTLYILIKIWPGIDQNSRVETPSGPVANVLGTRPHLRSSIEIGSHISATTLRRVKGGATVASVLITFVQYGSIRFLGNCTLAARSSRMFEIQLFLILSHSSCVVAYERLLSSRLFLGVEGIFDVRGCFLGGGGNISLR